MSMKINHPREKRHGQRYAFVSGMRDASFEERNIYPMIGDFLKSVRYEVFHLGLRSWETPDPVLIRLCDKGELNESALIFVDLRRPSREVFNDWQFAIGLNLNSIALILEPDSKIAHEDIEILKAARRADYDSHVILEYCDYGNASKSDFSVHKQLSRAVYEIIDKAIR